MILNTLSVKSHKITFRKFRKNLGKKLSYKKEVQTFVNWDQFLVDFVELKCMDSTNSKLWMSWLHKYPCTFPQHFMTNLPQLIMTFPISHDNFVIVNVGYQFAKLTFQSIFLQGKNMSFRIRLSWTIKWIQESLYHPCLKISSRLPEGV